MMAQSAMIAMWLLPGVIPIAAWVVWSDLTTMKIPNLAVLALIGLYALVGGVMLPFGVWAWSWAGFGVVLAVGFVVSSFGMGIGAGDAKFAAAMAPLIALGDLAVFLLLLSVLSVVTFVLHRLARSNTAIRAATPGWASWQRREFPFGVAMAPALVAYLVLVAMHGAA